jgi:DNA-binding PadR family transcriptional regulator
MMSLLELIGEHPFVTVRQMSRMEDVSQSRIYRELGELAEKGLVGSVNPRHPEIRARAFYYLTPEGRATLSLPRRRGSPRFLERIATVYEVRNLFISMRRVGLPLSRWQALTPAVEGVSLHGGAMIEGGGQLIVEWDRGGRPARLFRHRLRRVAALASKTGVGLLVVAADEARGVTALSALAGHLDLGGPYLGLTTRTILAAQGVPDADCYVPAIVDTISLGGFVQALPQPRGKTQVVSEGVMSFTGKWQGNTRLVVELAPLQKRLVDLLAGLPLATPEDLAVLAGGRSAEWVRRALADLDKRGLAGAYVPDPNLLSRYYFPTGTGLAFLSAGCGASAQAYAQARGWTMRKGEVSVSHLVRVFEHTREAREIVLALAHEARRRRQSITWYDEREAYVYFSAGGERKVLAPDARVRWGSKVFFVEVDRGTASLNRLADKLKTYYQFRRCAEHRRFGEAFCLLVVAPEESRERQWLEQTAELAKEFNGPPLDILTTTREMVQKRGLGAPIWRRTKGTHERVRLLEKS